MSKLLFSVFFLHLLYRYKPHTELLFSSHRTQLQQSWERPLSGGQERAILCFYTCVLRVSIHQNQLGAILKAWHLFTHTNRTQHRSTAGNWWQIPIYECSWKSVCFKEWLRQQSWLQRRLLQWRTTPRPVLQSAVHNKDTSLGLTLHHRPPMLVCTRSNTQNNSRMPRQFLEHELLRHIF